MSDIRLIAFGVFAGVAVGLLAYETYTFIRDLVDDINANDADEEEDPPEENPGGIIVFTLG